MLIGIMSDSHDNLPALSKAVTLFNERAVEAVLHAGDLISPFTAKIMKKLQMEMFITFGNHDGEKLGLKALYGDAIHRPPLELTLDHKKIVLLHEPDNLGAIVASKYYDLIVYGHTHEIDVREEKPLVVNPGECGGWVTGNSTVTIWNTSTDKVEAIEL